MKKVIVVLMLLVVSIQVLVCQVQGQDFAIRQGVNIEWFRSGTTTDDGVVYTWSDTREGGRDLFAQMVDENGNNLWGDDGLLIDNKTDRQEDPVVIGTTDNCVVIAWIDFRFYKLY